MELDESKAYVMPLIMGSAFDLADRPQSVYGEAQSLAATFRTDPEVVRTLVPECFTVSDEPTVTVAFGDYSRIDFMAGGDYRVAYVGVSARYEGDEEISGLFILIMWENRTLPIVLGREVIGIPKLAADISAARELPAGGRRARRRSPSGASGSPPSRTPSPRCGRASRPGRSSREGARPRASSSSPRTPSSSAPSPIAGTAGRGP